MGLFKLFKNRKVKTDRVGQPKARVLGEEAFADRQTRENFITGNCEIIVSAEKQIMDSKKEYEVVTSYLSDIQRIETLPEKERAKITEVANKIVTLNRERAELTYTPPKITMAQRLAISESDKDMEAEIKRLSDNEKYKLQVERDMALLEQERDSLDDDINTDIRKTQSSRKFLTAAAAVTLFAVIFLIALGIYTKKDVTWLILLVVLLGALTAGYTWFVHNRSHAALGTDKKKINRAITLLNKVKIKYVNVTNLLDYNYEKYHISGSDELEFNWKEYNRVLEEERRIRKSEQLVDIYNDELKTRLKAAGVLDAGIWVYQCEALVNSGEMVEVRHRLNTRRNKLRKAISYNQDQKKVAVLSLRNFAEKYRQYEAETRMIMARFNLTN